MVLVTSSKEQRLVCVAYIGVVTAVELEKSRIELEAMLAELPAGLRWLGDFSSLDRMEAGCETVIGKVMERIDQHGVELVVRVMPDATKDIGMNILTLFHYANRPRVATCNTMIEAAQVLGL
jgi:hypothetical protein